MTISSKYPDKNMGIRFQSGHGSYSRSWFIEGDHKLFQQLYQALNYSIFGLDEDDIYQNSTLEMIDQDGVIWEILRKKKQSWVMKDKKSTQLGPQDLLGSFPLDHPDQASGRYQLSFDQNDLFMSSLNSGQEKDQFNYLFGSGSICFDDFKTWLGFEQIDTNGRNAVCDKNFHLKSQINLTRL